MIPTHYVEADGQLWRPWEGGEVFHGDLSIAQRVCKGLGGDTVSLNNIKVYALKFAADANRSNLGYMKVTEWDCLNGWRKPSV